MCRAGRACSSVSRVRRCAAMAVKLAARADCTEPDVQPLAGIKAAALYADEVAVRVEVHAPPDLDMFNAPPLTDVAAAVLAEQPQLRGVLNELDEARSAGVIHDLPTLYRERLPASELAPRDRDSRDWEAVAFIASDVPSSHVPLLEGPLPRTLRLRSPGERPVTFELASPLTSPRAADVAEAALASRLLRDLPRVPRRRHGRHSRRPRPAHRRPHPLPRRGHRGRT